MNNIIITICFGWLGIHKFIRKQYGIGLLYLFTCGLFCIGWFYDIYIAYKEYKKTTNININNSFIEIKKENYKNNNIKKIKIVKLCDIKTLEEIYDCKKYCNELNDDEILTNMEITTEIVGNNDEKRWDIIYNEHGHNDLLGYIPENYNNFINDIITNNLFQYGNSYIDDDLNININVVYKIK